MTNEAEISTQRWRWTALSVYLLICFYDFMFVPIWYGLNRPDITALMTVLTSTDEVLVQMELMKTLTAQHNPFTLMGGGIFHLAFGAILTGSAVGMNK
jgi:tryptophan-rich sensory protein